MTITNPTSRATYLTNPAVSQYTYPFKVFDASQLSIIIVEDHTKVETPLLLTTDYTVSGVGGDTGGTITLTASGVAKAGTGNTLVILRNMPFVQGVDYRPHDIFPAETHERALDILTMQDQQLLELISRALLAPPGEAITWEDLLKLRDDAQEARDGAETAADTATGAAANAKASASQAAGSASTAQASAAQSIQFASVSQAYAEQAKNYAEIMEDVIDENLDISGHFWVQSINATRITRAGLRRSIKIYNLGG
jgi:hypothetical protein